MGSSAAPARWREARTSSDGGHEGVEALDADHRLELAGHRGVGGVLDDRRAAGDERAGVARPPRSNACRTAGWVAEVGAGVDRVGERRGEHDAGERVAGRRRAARARLAALPPVSATADGRGVVEGHDEGPVLLGHGGLDCGSHASPCGTPSVAICSADDRLVPRCSDPRMKVARRSLPVPAVVSGRCVGLRPWRSDRLQDHRPTRGGWPSWRPSSRSGATTRSSEARHPFDLTQRQAAGKFTTAEVDELMDRLQEDDDAPAPERRGGRGDARPAPAPGARRGARGPPRRRRHGHRTGEPGLVLHPAARGRRGRGRLNPYGHGPWAR